MALFTYNSINSYSNQCIFPYSEFSGGSYNNSTTRGENIKFWLEGYLFLSQSFIDYCYFLESMWLDIISFQLPLLSHLLDKVLDSQFVTYGTLRVINHLRLSIEITEYSLPMLIQRLKNADPKHFRSNRVGLWLSRAKFWFHFRKIKDFLTHLLRT